MKLAASPSFTNERPDSPMSASTVVSAGVARWLKELAPQGIFTTDAELRIVSWNRWLETHTGRNAEEMLGTDLLDAYPELRARGLDQYYLEALTGQAKVLSQRFHRYLLPMAPTVADSGLEHMLQTAQIASLTEHGRIIGTITVIEDVTERVVRERELRDQVEALRESEAKFRSMANTTPAIIWTADPAGRITFHNQRWLDYTGIDPRDNVSDWPRLVLHPDDHDRCIAAWTHALQTGSDYEIEVRNRYHDGTYRWFLTRATPIRNEQGAIVAWYGSTTDIDERKRAEQALREADRRKDEFLAMLAHELRNPLAPIRNAVQLLRLAGPREPMLDGARDVIDRQVTHLVRLVDDLMDVSRVSRGKVQLQREPLDLVTMALQAVESCRPFIDSRRHNLTVTVPDTPVHVEGDPVRLVQVMCNLLNNAAKYTDENGRIMLTVETSRAGDQAEALVRVRDDGRGIEPAALENVFDLFFQADRNLDRTEGGLGIGLSLVRSIIDMHGGRVEAHSAGRGKGSEFIVRLPCLASTSTGEPRQASGASTKVAHRLRVLVVDDNRDSAESMAMLLEIHGHDVLIAHDGEQAVEAALRERPDVVLLDLGLPKLDGYAACRAMREDGLQDKLIVAMTGYGQEEDRQLSQAAGFSAHLVKPVDVEELDALLASLGQRSTA